MFTLAALLALGLAACGGSSDSDSSQSTAAGSPQSATTAPSGQADDNQGGNEKHSGDDKGGSKRGAGSSRDDNPSGSDEGSAEFRTPGGDNSIQNYGEEAEASEIEEVEDTIASYFDARAKAEWEQSCEDLAKMAREPIEQLGEKSPQLKGKSCGAIIGALSAQVPAAARKSPLVEGIASVRFKGDNGFALFRGPGGAKFFIPVVKEGDEWKVGALVASEFP